MTIPLITFDHVSVIRGARAVLADVSFSIAAGEHVAILGHNGSGKSTIIKAITRELYPAGENGGRVVLFGQEHWNVSDLRSRLGIVSDDLMQDCRRAVSVNDVVISGFFSSIGLFVNHDVTAAMRAKAAEILAFLEIPHLADRRMDELSFGEARRALIGRALVHDPEALVLDEPMNSLDLHARHRFRETLRRVAGRGTGIVMVTHEASDVIPEIGRIILLKDGRVFADDRTERVLTPATLSAFFAVPVTVRRYGDYYQVA